MRSAFSMLELVFVIVILGILASIAIPKFSVTRSDAQTISVQSDIINTMSAIQREVFTQNTDPNIINGEWIIKTAGLSKSRWIAQGEGIKLSKDGEVDPQNDCITFEFRNKKELFFKITQKQDSPICNKLYSQYKDEEKVIPLITSSSF